MKVGGHVTDCNNVGIVSNSGNFVSDVVEITLLRKDRSPAFGFVRELPHRLDRDCIPSKRHVAKALMAK